MSAPEVPSVRRLEVADILRAQGPRYRRTHRLTRVQGRAMRDIERCRTPAAGGRAEVCDTCGARRIVYNSCRNRHCPKCQTLQQERWKQRRCAELLPVQYFHVVFTLPHALNSLAQGNPRLLYHLLFEAAAGALATLAGDPRRLGARIGFTLVLHTWGRNLSQHIHLHGLVTGGGLSLDASRWVACRPGYLLPVRALSRLLRGRYLAGLWRAFEEGRIRFAGTTAPLAEPSTFAALLRQLRRQEWVVYCKAPLAGPEQVVGYLARYTHRVAISNERLVAFHDGVVSFRWKDHADGGRRKTLTLSAEEFIRRFLLHVLPAGFMRIRHFGLYANRSRTHTLDRCRQLLGQPPPEHGATPESVRDLMLRLTGDDIGLCPACRRGRLHVVQLLSPTDHPDAPPIPWDTS